MIKEEAGPERLGQQQSLLYPPPASLIPSIPRPGRGEVGSALPPVSLEMIACLGATREEAAQLQTLRTFMKGELFFYFISFKPHISLPSGGTYWPKTQ